MFGRLAAAFLCTFLALGQPLAHAQPRPPGFELAEAYFKKGNFASAYLLALPVAHSGDARAQYMLGLMSYHGLSPVARDLKEAARWFGLAANGGNADAQYALAQAHVRGDGVPVDKPKALEWLGRAAQGGQTAAIMSLARLYDEGIEIAQDRSAATGWVRRAAELGDSRALVMLGERLTEGVGAPADPEAGRAVIRRAAALGEPLALLKLVRDIVADENAPPEVVIQGHAYATLAEERAAGDMKKQAAAAKAELAKRMSPADVTAAGEKLAELRPRPK